MELTETAKLLSAQSNAIKKAKEIKNSTNKNTNIFPSTEQNMGSCYHEKNDNNNTRTTYIDKNNDGVIDGASYFQLDKNNNVQTAKFDADNNGTIDRTSRYQYDKNGNLIENLNFSGNFENCEIIDIFDENENITNRYYYENNEKEGTRTALKDNGADGTIDSASYFLDDEEGKCLYSQQDFDFDGKIDETNHYLYWDDGSLQGIEVDEDGDGKFDRLDLVGNDGEIILSTNNYIPEK